MIMSRWIILLCALLLKSCINIPEGVTPIQPFDAQRYMGVWYEIARTDNRFERGLSRVWAHYTLEEGGRIRVENHGFSIKENHWRVARGKAYFVSRPDVAYLKVSFFGPFYGAYIVFWLDKDYRYAFVTSYDKSYLWFLSRTPSVPQSMIDTFMEEAGRLGFDTEKIIFCPQKVS